MQTPWFFERLGIEPTEDSGTIKKAYAVELKKIDQETQAKEFEKLREAYDLARNWINSSKQRNDEQDSYFLFDEEKNEAPPYQDEGFAWYNSKPNTPSLKVAKIGHAERSNQQSDEENQTLENKKSSELPPSYTGNTAYSTDTNKEEKLSPKKLFEEFIRCACESPVDARSRLNEALNKDVLISLDARMQFELQVAQWLYQNQYPSHQLFEAAVEVFRWHEQLPLHDHLKVIAWLQAIVEQWQQWQQQTPEWQRCVLVALTKSKFMISLREKQALAAACARYPLLMRLRVSEERWQKINASTISETQPKDHLLPRILTIVAMWFVASMFVIGVMSVLDEHLNFEWKIAEKQQLVSSPPTAAEKQSAEKVIENYQTKNSLEPKPPAISALEANRQKQQQTIEHYQQKQEERNSEQKPTVKPVSNAPAEKKTTKNSVPLPPVVVAKSFNMSPELCHVRAVLVGRWADLYANDINHQSFKNEVQKCLDKGWWPKGKPAAEKYLKRLAASWASPDYPNNKLLEGLELEARHRAEDLGNDLVMMCDKDRRVNPFIFPEGADCVSLAATYEPKKINVTPASPELCQLREKATNWHFDQGNEWNNYLAFKQEMTDCFMNGWWDRPNFKRDLKRLKGAWRNIAQR